MTKKGRCDDNASAPTSSHSVLLPFALPLPPTYLSSQKTMFDPNTNLSQQKHVHFPDFVGQSFDALNLGVVRRQRTVQGYGNFRSWNGREGRFGDGQDESGVRTPPLWPGSPPQRPNHYRCLSPSSKAQAIARGQRELMEMVSKMPESCYELSLRDIVEQPMVEAKQESAALTEDNNRREKEEKEEQEEKKKKSVKKAQINRSGSIDNGGFLLKMVFPVSFGSKKKKKKKKNDSNSKVSPRPSVSDASVKAEDKEWWKKRFSGSGESESGGSSIHSRSTKSSRSSSSSSSSSSTASRRRRMGGCCSFIRSRRSNVSE